MSYIIPANDVAESFARLWHVNRVHGLDSAEKKKKKDHRLHSSAHEPNLGHQPEET